MWLGHDMIEVEKQGKPAVLLASGRFEQGTIASTKVLGMPDLRYVVVPGILRNLTPEETLEQVEQTFDTLVRQLTTDTTKDGAAPHKAQPAGIERFMGEDQLGALEEMNRQYLERDWGDGFPLLPPTSQAVEALLKGTNLPREHMLCEVPPGYGLATVEKIAINAAMAGARPEHMPVIMAALKAVSQFHPEAAEAFLMGTSAHASFLVVNGPIANELGLNSRVAMGPGRENQANLTIGRAYTLCLKNIGHWYLGHLDMDVMGSVRKFSVCVAENEEHSPWESFHVEQGFESGDSVVTVLITRGEVDVSDQGNPTAELLLKNIAYNSIFCTWDMAAVNGSVHKGSAWDTIILASPDFIQPVAQAGFTKRQAKEFIHHHAKFNLGKMMITRPLQPETVAPQWRWLLDLSEKERDEILMPIRESPDRYQIVCVGGSRSKIVIMPSHPGRHESAKVDPYRPKGSS